MPFLKRYKSLIVGLIVLSIVELFLFLTNVIPGTFLMGWDNVMPEFNFRLNLERSIVSIWQSYRGLGHFDGMSHAANLLHTMYLWALSFLFPLWSLRYLFTFAAHFLGGVGMYIFLVLLLKQQKHKVFLALSGGIFYLFNLITIQMFFAPLEGFSMHFASLPWLALTSLLYLHSHKKRVLLLYFIVLVLTTPQYFVTTLVFASMFLLLSIIFGTGIAHPHIRRTIFKKGFIMIGSFFCINAFWLLPYIIGAPSNAPIITTAKINQMSSQEIFLRNQAFGDIYNVLMLRGFSLDFTDLMRDSTTANMMGLWRDSINTPVSQTISIAIVVLMLLGVGRTIFGLLKREKSTLSLSLLPCLLFGGIGFVALGNNIVILKQFMELIRTHLPIVGEAFRFPFTKFSLLYVMSYTIFVVVGIKTILSILYWSPKLIQRSIISLGIVACLLLARPAFSGNFLYDNLKVNLPQSYLSLFSYMSALDKDLRFAVLPMHEYWSWKFYRWGYRGSGFLWHGIPQATLDRAFDPWSNYNEQFYWEFDHALYSKDISTIDLLFSKYNIDGIIFDESIISASHNRALFTDEITRLLATSSVMELTRSFGEIHVYRSKVPHSAVELINNLPNVFPPYTFATDDQAYTNLGNYAISTNTSNYIYPFRGLFSKRSTSERQEYITETIEDITLESPSIVGYKYNIPKKDTLIFDTKIENTLLPELVTPCNPFRRDKQSAILLPDDENALRLSVTNQRNCLSFSLGYLEHRNGYLVAVESRHVTGTPIKFGIINQTAKHVETEVYLPNDPTWKMTYFFLPPLASDGLGYNAYITNDAVSNFESTNDIKQIRVYNLDYDALKAIQIVQQPTLADIPIQPDIVYQPHQTFNVVTFASKPNLINPTIVLSQSFHRGWKAYEISCEFGVMGCKLSVVSCMLSMFVCPDGVIELKDHTLVNNWENGWKLPVVSNDLLVVSNEQTTDNGQRTTDNKQQTTNYAQPTTHNPQPTTIIIFFLPQLYQWIGFGLVPLPFLVLLFRHSRKKKIHFHGLK